ncbi:macrolide-efflux protein [Lachnospiraceae bacterium KM106-2]|nr:macrolide-efflux protein [Lachnospiraceae bacterium KM106-2]
MKAIEDWQLKFIKIWSGQAVSILTSSVLQMAIVWYLTERTGSSAVLSFATLIGYLPQAVLGTFIGVYIDRYNRKKIMIYADLFIAAASLVLVFVGMFGSIPIWLIMVVLFVRSIGSAFHYPALQAVTPSIVPKEHLTKYAGYAQSFESVSMVASPAIAAVLFSIWDLNIIILLDVFGAIFAVSMLALVKLPQRVFDKEDGDTTESSNLLEEVKAGLRILKGVKGMRALLIVSALYAIIYFPIGTLYPLITMSYFGGSFSASSVVEIVFSVGMLTGSLLLGIFGDKINKRWAIIGSIGFYGLGVAITGLLPASGLYVFVVLSGVMGISVPFYTGVEIAIIQSRIKEEYLGRILALSGSITTITMPIGLILSGIFSDFIGIQNWFLTLGITCLILAAAAMLMPSFHYCTEEA